MNRMLLAAKQILTEKDNATYSAPSFLWVLCVLVGLALEAYCVVHGIAFDMSAYGVGAAAMLSGGGIAHKLSSGGS